MWRGFFLAVGIYSFVLGLECLVIDKATLASEGSGATAFEQRLTTNYREFTPPEWAPWSLMSGGAVVMLYSFTVPRKLKS